MGQKVSSSFEICLRVTGQYQTLVPDFWASLITCHQVSNHWGSPLCHHDNIPAVSIQHPLPFCLPSRHLETHSSSLYNMEIVQTYGNVNAEQKLIFSLLLVAPGRWVAVGKPAACSSTEIWMVGLVVFLDDKTFSPWLVKSVRFLMKCHMERKRGKKWQRKVGEGVKRRLGKRLSGCCSCDLPEAPGAPGPRCSALVSAWAQDVTGGEHPEPQSQRAVRDLLCNLLALYGSSQFPQTRLQAWISVSLVPRTLLLRLVGYNVPTAWHTVWKGTLFCCLLQLNMLALCCCASLTALTSHSTCWVSQFSIN